MNQGSTERVWLRGGDSGSGSQKSSSPSSHFASLESWFSKNGHCHTCLQPLPVTQIAMRGSCRDLSSLISSSTKHFSSECSRYTVFWIKTDSADFFSQITFFFSLIFLNFIILYVLTVLCVLSYVYWVFWLSVYLCITCMPVRGHWVPCNWNCRWLWTTVWMLVFELGLCKSNKCS